MLEIYVPLLIQNLSAGIRVQQTSIQVSEVGAPTFFVLELLLSAVSFEWILQLQKLKELNGCFLSQVLSLCMQLWMVFHVCARVRLLGAHFVVRVPTKAHCQPLEDLHKAVSCVDGLARAHQRVSHVPQLSCTNHVQIHQGTSRTK